MSSKNWQKGRVCPRCGEVVHLTDRTHTCKTVEVSDRRAAYQEARAAYEAAISVGDVEQINAKRDEFQRTLRELYAEQEAGA